MKRLFQQTEILLVAVVIGLGCVAAIEGASLWKSFCAVPECPTCGERMAVGKQFGTYCQRCQGKFKLPKR